MSAKRATKPQRTSNPNWADHIMELIDSAIGDQSISRRELADGLEEIEDKAGEWARQMRDEMGGDES